MKISLKYVGNGVFISEAPLELKQAIYEVELKNMDMRSNTQNRSLHLYFSLLAAELNKGGLTVEKTIKVDTAWTGESIKELIWKPIQNAVLNKKSTTKLTKDEVSKVYDTLNYALSTKYGLYVAFPSQD